MLNIFSKRSFLSFFAFLSLANSSFFLADEIEVQTEEAQTQTQDNQANLISTFVKHGRDNHLLRILISVTRASNWAKITPLQRRKIEGLFLQIQNYTPGSSEEYDEFFTFAKDQYETYLSALGLQMNRIQIGTPYEDLMRIEAVISTIKGFCDALLQYDGKKPEDFDKTCLHVRTSLLKRVFWIDRLSVGYLKQLLMRNAKVASFVITYVGLIGAFAAWIFFNPARAIRNDIQQGIKHLEKIVDKGPEMAFNLGNGFSRGLGVDTRLAEVMERLLGPVILGEDNKPIIEPGTTHPKRDTKIGIFADFEKSLDELKEQIQDLIGRPEGVGQARPDVPRPILGQLQQQRNAELAQIRSEMMAERSRLAHPRIADPAGQANPRAALQGDQGPAAQPAQARRLDPATLATVIRDFDHLINDGRIFFQQVNGQDRQAIERVVQRFDHALHNLDVTLEILANAGVGTRDGYRSARDWTARTGSSAVELARRTRASAQNLGSAAATQGHEFYNGFLSRLTQARDQLYSRCISIAGALPGLGGLDQRRPPEEPDLEADRGGAPNVQDPQAHVDQGPVQPLPAAPALVPAEAGSPGQGPAGLVPNAQPQADRSLALPASAGAEAAPQLSDRTPGEADRLLGPQDPVIRSAPQGASIGGAIAAAPREGQDTAAGRSPLASSSGPALAEASAMPARVQDGPGTAASLAAAPEAGFAGGAGGSHVASAAAASDRAAQGARRFQPRQTRPRASSVQPVRPISGTAEQDVQPRPRGRVSSLSSIQNITRDQAQFPLRPSGSDIRAHALERSREDRRPITPALRPGDTSTAEGTHQGSVSVATAPDRAASVNAAGTSEAPAAGDRPTGAKTPQTEGWRARSWRLACQGASSVGSAAKTTFNFLTAPSYPGQGRRS